MVDMNAMMAMHRRHEMEKHNLRMTHMHEHHEMARRHTQEHMDVHARQEKEMMGGDMPEGKAA